MRTAKEEKEVCRRLARHFLSGDRADVTAESLAMFLFDQRDSGRRFPNGVEQHSLGWDEIPDEGV